MIASQDRRLIEPWDEHNQKLVAEVHPLNWKNPEPAPPYNLVVIGAGTAGLITASGAAGLGAKVALIERHLMGGDCLNVGCVPSKAMIRSARAFADVGRAADYGIVVPPSPMVDFPAVMERVRKLRAGISPHDSARRYQQLGVDVFFGEGKFTSPQTVEVDGKVLRFSKAVIATGARALILPIKGLREAGCLTNETVFSLTQLPRRLGVIGAGPIGCELAQAFRRFGSEVIMLEAEDAILPREDRDAAEIVARAFRRDGIKLHCDCKILEVQRRADEKVIHWEGHGGNLELAVDEILLGVGRAPNVEGLNLEAAGVEYGKQGVHVNDYLRTTNPRIYAAGDICLPYKFTHTADATARIVIQNALFAGRKKMSALVVPWCTYTDPEIAHVGLYEAQAKEKGIRVQTFTETFERVDRAVLESETEGLIKVHVRQGTDKILGATIVARHAGEMISEVTLAMTGHLGLKTIAQTIHPYPTQAEAIKKIADAYNRTRLTPMAKKLFTRWLEWTR